MCEKQHIFHMYKNKWFFKPPEKYSDQKEKNIDQMTRAIFYILLSFKIYSN